MRSPVRPEFRWTLSAAVALGVGVTFAKPYARLAAPYYGAVVRAIATGHPWEISSVDVKDGISRLSAELQLHAFVRRHAEDPNPAARVIGRVQVGEAVETPVVFWTILLAWPAASMRQRMVRVIAGVPAFLGLEAITTATQFILPMAQASAMLAGDNDPVTAWDRWSRFLEAGGQFIVVCAAAFIIATLTDARRRRRGSFSRGPVSQPLCQDCNEAVPVVERRLPE
jgi:hypothetical protein